MKASILIKELTALIEKYGDFKVNIPYGGDEWDSVPANSIQQCIDDESGKLEFIKLSE